LKELLVWQLKKNVKLLYILFYPGVVIHELGHLVGCQIALAKVRSVQLASKTGGEVVHEASRIPVVGNFLISIFPLIFGAFIIFLITILLKVQNVSVVELVLIRVFSYYILVAVLLTTFPSIQDIKNALFGYLILIAALALIAFKTNWAVPAGVYNLEFFCAITLSVVNLIMIVVGLVKKR
jgi:hypothetical protein